MIGDLIRIAARIDSIGRHEISDRIERMVRESIRRLPSGVEVSDVREEISKSGLPPYMRQMMGFSGGESKPLFDVPKDRWGELFSPGSKAFTAADPLSIRDKRALGIDDDDAPKGSVVRMRGGSSMDTIHEGTHSFSKPKGEVFGIGNGSAESQLSYVANKDEIDAQINSLLSFMYSQPTASFIQAFAHQNGFIIDDYTIRNSYQAMLEAILWDELKRSVMTMGFGKTIRARDQIIEMVRDRFVKERMPDILSNLSKMHGADPVRRLVDRNRMGLDDSQISFLNEQIRRPNKAQWPPQWLIDESESLSDRLLDMVSRQR